MELVEVLDQADGQPLAPLEAARTLLQELRRCSVE
jgi:hypothetical protein